MAWRNLLLNHKEDLGKAESFMRITLRFSGLSWKQEPQVLKQKSLVFPSVVEQEREKP